MLTAKTVIQGAIDVLNEPTVTIAAPSSGNFWTAAELFGYMQDGLRTLAKRTGYWRGKADVPVSAASNQASLPADCLELLSVLNTTSASVMMPFSAVEMDECRPTWEADTGYPRRYSRDTNNYNAMTVYPKPDGAYTLRVRYTAIPTVPELSSPAATGDFDTDLDIPEYFGPGLIYYVLFRAFQKEGELQSGDRSSYYLQAFEGYVERMKADAASHNDRRTRRTKGVFH